VTTVDEHRKLDAVGATKVGQGIEGGSDGAAGVEYIVHQHDDFARDIDADLAKIREVVDTEGQRIAMDSSFDAVFMDPPVYAGLEEARGDAIVVRVMAKVVPDQQFIAARLLRERIKGALDKAGLHIPLAQMQIIDAPIKSERVDGGQINHEQGTQ
jgi:small-conductance mechanosensitive channel